MLPTVSLFGFSVQSMWLMCLAGAGICCAFVLPRSRRMALPGVDITNAGAMGLIGILAGGKLLYLLTIAPLLVQNWRRLVQAPALLAEITLTSGTVYYGGLLGFIASVHWYLHRYHLNAPLFWDCLAPALPLFHVFGRIGCFLNGCCYGVESRHFGLAFTCSLSAPNGVPYFPVQLAEAAFEALIFLLVWRFALRTEGHGKALPFYLLYMPPCGFCWNFCAATQSAASGSAFPHPSGFLWPCSHFAHRPCAVTVKSAPQNAAGPGHRPLYKVPVFLTFSFYRHRIRAKPCSFGPGTKGRSYSMPMTIATSANPISMSQAITDLIESIALEETALSHILHAESEKLHKAISMGEVTLEEIMNVNDTVMSMVSTINELEHTLRDKLEFISNNLYYPSRESTGA